ncbi:MAG: hypothetical protein UR96_C0019G0004 [candidate division WS6 bacterium GW2011_GWC1_36_11]|uniref:Uncharacterized protein n=1 Tax=candidate division WS6 bacterium GW2011_GWC1_36_11 TaxID=1619090 RepID=A0A0G0FY38_9BACT|nr:MAG: hypothetical protein UR96_C0019G0004 [candidate division WS6 bacterium GW2011_GWC1_36_11]HAM96255.1 hypothetical protein [Patescibacteria group bacterium]
MASKIQKEESIPISFSSPRTEIQERPSLYVRHDFPVINFGQGELFIDWESHGKNDLSELLENGLQISLDDYNILDGELEEIKEKFGLKKAGFGWTQRENVTFSLTGIMTKIGRYMTYLWGNQEDHKGTSISMSSKHKIHNGELWTTDEAIFVTECIANYLRHFDPSLEIPYIRTSLINTIDTEFNEIPHEDNLFEYSFTIPFVQDHDYNAYLERNLYLTDKGIVFEGENIVIKGSIVARLIQKNNELFWDVGDIYDDTTAILLFKLLGTPLKNQLY